MKYSEIKEKIKRYDFIEFITKFGKEPTKGVVVSMSKDILKIAPILEDKDKSAVCPVIAIPNDLVSEVKRAGDHMLLFYSDLNNFHIEKAILSKNNNRRANAKI
jgi:hypothetical protein